MKILSKKNNWVLLFGLILVGCVSSNPNFFSSVETTEDPAYGYSAENPIAIKNGDLRSSIDASYYYLSKLRTSNGSKLELIQRYSIENPKFEKSDIQLRNRATGEPLNYGNGPFLDVYILVPVNSNDTLDLYINPYLKGNVKAPMGLKFDDTAQ